MTNMKKIILSTIGIVGISLLFRATVFAQGMMGFLNSSPDSTTIQSQQQEEKDGKNILDTITNKTVTCSQLDVPDFEKIGEYFMGQSIGDTSRHIAMNAMIKRMMGEQGEAQMHNDGGRMVVSLRVLSRKQLYDEFWVYAFRRIWLDRNDSLVVVDNRWNYRAYQMAHGAIPRLTQS